LGEEGAGDAGEAAGEVVEAADAAQQVADDEEGPALAEDLQRHGHRAVLAI